MTSQYPFKLQLSEAEIRSIRASIDSFIHRTPLISSKSINADLGFEVYFKCENLQKCGAFKARGAHYALECIDDEDLANGVITHSSGNHGQALALAARNKGVRATIVMPRTAPELKKQAVDGYGAKIVLCEPTVEDRESTVAKLIEADNSLEIHPFNDIRIIHGQSTCGLEVFDEQADLDAIFSPLGGGGITAGTVLSRDAISPNTAVYAAEPEGADDGYRSWKSGELQTNNETNTIADGLLTNVGKLNWSIIRPGIEDVVLVSDEEIIDAMKWIYERLKLVVEPSGAVTFAAVRKMRTRLAGKKVAVILSGGNIDLTKLGQYF